MITTATDLLGWVSLILALFSAILAGWYTWKLVAGGKVDAGISVLCGTLMLGGLSFIIGFFRVDNLDTKYQSGSISWGIYHGTIRTVAGCIGGYVFASKQTNTGD